MAFSQSIVERALVEGNRCCSICHKFCGTKIELHHIRQKADGGEDTFENCIPLCFDCHADVKSYNPRHPKGKKYSESELISHRDKWYKKANAFKANELNDPEKDNRDFLLFNNICGLLADENLPFLYHYDYHFSFEAKVKDTLDMFIDRCYSPFYEFLDADLESRKADLLASCEDLIGLIGAYSSYSQQCYLIDNVGNNVERIHTTTLLIKHKFDDLVRYARRIYPV